MKEEAVKALPGERTIRLTLHFWTNGIAEEEGFIVPKQGWSFGTVGLRPNQSHGIEPSEPIPFNSLMELPAKIEELLIREGISLHTARKMAKYIYQEE